MIWERWSTVRVSVPNSERFVSKVLGLCVKSVVFKPKSERTEHSGRQEDASFFLFLFSLQKGVQNTEKRIKKSIQTYQYKLVDPGRSGRRIDKQFDSDLTCDNASW